MPSSFLAQDLASDHQPLPLDWLQVLIRAGQADDPALLAQIADAMPEQTLVLSEKAVEVNQLLLERLKRLPEDSEQTRSELARLSNNLSARLSNLGRREEALAQAQEAVRLCRQLAQARPDAFLPNLATSLNNLANRLSALGRREEALAQAEEAVRLYRQLAQARPDAFLPDLARSLAVHCNCLVALERHSDALQATTEAIRLLAPPFAQVPAAFAPLMGAIVQLYLRTSEAAQQPPDTELLAPVLEVFARLKNPPASK
jgi:tetratricopeptide (TPR) repeat protein